ncbi:hypothetical protein C7382_10737 [Porphyromonas loveana]|uniref:Uncharacterized protein n=1 Tax=Porphyromonas loveana TaxID=1884669 RepID=A0A2U1FES9_9PORP|nr:hypothetical protein C7382_10737 [Porphyromonas loveana]
MIIIISFLIFYTTHEYEQWRKGTDIFLIRNSLHFFFIRNKLRIKTKHR